MDSTLQGNYEMGEYSTVSNYRQPHGETGEEVSTTNQPLPQLFYTQAGNTVFAEIFVVLISDVTFIMKFKKLNNCDALIRGRSSYFEGGGGRCPGR